MKPVVMFVMVCLVLLLGIWLPQIHAVSVSLQDIPLSIDQDKQQDVSLLFDCANCTSDSYIRAVFFPAGTSSYFGFTQSAEGSWINAPGGSCTKYFAISSSMLKDGTWSGKLKIKPDIASSYYKGPGEYQFKVGRYTGSCGAPVWSEEKTIAITGPSHTPTSTGTATPAPTSSSTPQPTHTPTSVGVSTTPTTTVGSPTKGISIVLSPTYTDSEIDESTVSMTSRILGVESVSEASYGADAANTMRPYIISCVLIAMGFGLLSGLFTWKTHDQISKSEDK